ncbi:S-phase kinase-associated protein 2 [Rhynochetos jubatus]
MAANYSSRWALRREPSGFRPARGGPRARRDGSKALGAGLRRVFAVAAMHRKHLQEIPSSSSNISTSFTLDSDSSKPSEFVSGVGAPAVNSDNEDSENTPQDLLATSSSPLVKRQRVKDVTIVHGRQLLRAAESGVSWDLLPDELLIAVFACLPLNDLLNVSMICKRWHRIAFDESLWQTLDLTGKNLLPGVVGQLLPVGVTVFRCPRSSIGTPLFKTCKPLKIQHMDLSNCVASVADLHSILCLCESLQSLSVEGLVLSDDIIKSIAKNHGLIRLNLCGCSGFSPDALGLMLSSLRRLEELNLSWCDFTVEHVNVAVNNITPKVTQLNFSGYRQRLEIADIRRLVGRCPLLVHLDLSDSIMLNHMCFEYFHQLQFLQHLGLSRCYQLLPASLIKLGEIPTLKTLQVFGIMPDNSLLLLKEVLPQIKFNGSPLTNIARPTAGKAKSDEIWGIKCRLRLKPASGF